MYEKIEISGKITVETGMHIGGSSQFAAIGAVDSPVIRDRKSDLPMIPGSSLKGKLRTLLAKRYTEGKRLPQDFNLDDEKVMRLFGNSKKDENDHRNSRLLFSDMVLSNESELREQEIYSATEVKFENTINRLTAVANPRQIERVIRGAEFQLDIIYNVETQDEGEILEDFKNLKEAITMLQYDYLGGSGSRGYGKVKVTDMKAEIVIGKLSRDLIEKCNSILKGEIYEI